MSDIVGGLTASLRDRNHVERRIVHAASTGSQRMRPFPDFVLGPELAFFPRAALNGNHAEVRFELVCAVRNRVMSSIVATNALAVTGPTPGAGRRGQARRDRIPIRVGRDARVIRA